MVSDRIPPIDDESRVIKFRPRRSVPRGLASEKRHLEQTRSPVRDLSKFEGGRPDNHRHRMIMNALGMSLAIVLIIMGEWFASVIAHQ